MVESTLAVIGLDGIDWKIKRPWFMISAAVIGVTLGLAVTWGWHTYMTSLQPVTASIRSLEVSPRDAHGSLVLTLRFASSPAPDCVRVGTHQLSQLPEHDMDGEQKFILLTSSLAGKGYSVRASRSFTVEFPLPSSTPAGKYTYAYKTLYGCGPWGLVPFSSETSAEVVIP